jgi:hypothetical protein
MNSMLLNLPQSGQQEEIRGDSSEIDYLSDQIR